MTAYADALIAPSTGSSPAAAAPSKKRIITGRVLSGLALAFLAFDTVLHLLAPAPALESAQTLGFSPSVIVPLGIVELVCWVLAVVPRTAVLGTLLWTGYLGGAIATHVRVGNPVFSHILFPVYIAALLWAGLALRDKRVERLFIGR
jgi:hypothetical protein